jgi:hypothetical protein
VRFAECIGREVDGKLLFRVILINRTFAKPLGKALGSVGLACMACTDAPKASLSCPWLCRVCALLSRGADGLMI